MMLAPLLSDPQSPLFWHDLFHTDVSVAEKVARPIIVYIFLVVGLRLAGKRELAQLNPFDLVVLLTISNTVQNAIIGNDNSVLGGLIGASTLLGLNYLVVRFLFRHPRVNTLVEGSPDVLIENGTIRQEALDRELITLAELQSAAHKQGLDSLADVDRAVLEPGGTITFSARKPNADEVRHRELIEEITALRRLIDAKAR